jgi:hypothetical protein
MVAKRNMAGLSGSVIELSNYLEQRISQKSAEYAAVSLLSIYFVSLFIFANFSFDVIYMDLMYNTVLCLLR